MPVTIPVGGETGTYVVDWGDGNSSTHSGDAMHTYGAPGTYTVSITGDFTRIYLGNDTGYDYTWRPVINPVAAKLVSIEQWGDSEWTSMEDAFQDAVNMTYNATDVPNLSSVTDMSRMFFHANKFNGNISGWDVSNVTNMVGMFAYADSFNQPIGDWNVSNVTDMVGVLDDADSLNQNLGNWYIALPDIITTSDPWNVASVMPQNEDLATYPPTYTVKSVGGEVSSLISGKTLYAEEGLPPGIYDITIQVDDRRVYGTDNEKDVTVVFYDADSTASVTGTVFYDANGDGTKGDGDVPVPNHIVHLVPPEGLETQIRTITTDANGTYNFDDVIPFLTWIIQSGPFPRGHMPHDYSWY